MTKFISSLILKKIVKRNLNKKRIALAGMTYKKNVPDFRNSLSIEILKIIKKKYPHIVAYDPYANYDITSKLKIKNKANLNKFDHVFFLTDHSIFKKYKNKKGRKFSFLFGNQN